MKFIFCCNGTVSYYIMCNSWFLWNSTQICSNDDNSYGTISYVMEPVKKLLLKML